MQANPNKHCRAACKVLTHGNFLGPRVSAAAEDVLVRSCGGCSLPRSSSSLPLPTPTLCEAVGFWEVAWETRCAFFPGSSAGLLHLLAGVQHAEPPPEQGFQLSPRTCAVGRAETSVVGLCFRSHLCVEASWPGNTGFTERLFLFFFFLVNSLTGPRGTLGAASGPDSMLWAEQILMAFVQAED